MDKITTIQVSVETWKKLIALKDNPGVSFDEVINKLLEKMEK